MKIVIAGAGQVGTHLAKMLSEASHSITVMDWEYRPLRELALSNDIMTVVGDITAFDTHHRSEVERCDLFVATSYDENANILAAVLAKQLGAKKSICRIDNDEYMIPNNKEIFTNMGIDFLFYPEKVAAQEVITLLGHNATTEYVDFSGGKLVVVAFRIEEHSPHLGRSIEEIWNDRKRGDLEYRTIAIARGADTIIPDMNDALQINDMVYIICKSSISNNVLKFMGKTNINIDNLMILGGSRIGRRVAMTLEDEVNVKIIDYDQEKANKLAEDLDRALVINVDGRRMDIMIEEGLERMDAFVAVTGRSETNILAGMYAKRLGVKRVIAEVENMDYIALAESVGVDSIINKKLITASSIFRFTMNTDVQAIRCLSGCDAELLEFIVKPESEATKNTIANLHLPEGAIIGGLVRGESVMIADQDTQLNAYDRVVLFALPSAASKIERFFE